MDASPQPEPEPQQPKNKQSPSLSPEPIAKKRPKQKSKQDIFHHLIEVYQANPNKIADDDVPHEVQDIHQLLVEEPKNRTNRILKKIRAQLSQLKCFKTPPLNQQNPQFLQIFKRDNTNILNMIASFVEITKYKKGTIIEATAMERKSVKILLMGEIIMFEPINYKAFKSCQKRLKNGEILVQAILGGLDLMGNINILNKAKEIAVEGDGKQQQAKNNQYQQQNDRNNANPQKTVPNSPKTQTFPTKHTTQTQANNPQLQLQLQKSLLQSPSPTQKSTPNLTPNQCRELLTKCNIISPLSPHKETKSLKMGDFVFDKDHPMFTDQKPEYYASTLCCGDCIFLELGYEIAREVILLINSDRERPFIQSLLFKFPMLQYFEAKQYVTQDFMITNEIQQQDGVKVAKRAAVQIIRQLKVISSLNFQLAYTGQLYLIISGTVTLVIDQISERKPSTLEYIIPQKSVMAKQVLHLYKNDIFGFEELGLNVSCGLRYLVEIGAKLLKINGNVLRMHMQSIEGFREEIENVKRVRNQILAQILQKMQQSLQHQQITRHSSITYSSSSPTLHNLKPTKSLHLPSPCPPIKQLKYLGHQNYQSVVSKIHSHFSPDNASKPKQTLSPEIVRESGLGIEFAKNLLGKPQQNIQIKDGWIQIRNGKGGLLRKKKVKKVVGEGKVGDGDGPGDGLLRRLGILNSKEIADHNFQMVTKRPSKYQFQDLAKEAKQFKKIRDKETSLPKLTKFYAKKQDRLFTILYKKTHL